MSADVKKKLAPFRKEIDRLDNQIIALLGERYAVVRQVAELKIREDIQIVQSNRVHEVKERNAKIAKKHKVSPDLIRTLYALIIDEAHVIEHAMKDKALQKNKRKKA